MKLQISLKGLAKPLVFVLAFGVSVYAVSNLLPLLLRIAVRGFNLSDGVPMAGYLLATFAAVTLLANAIYDLEKRTGRVRNRVRWFE